MAVRSDFWGADQIYCGTYTYCVYQIYSWWGADITARSPLFPSPGLSHESGERWPTAVRHDPRKFSRPRSAVEVFSVSTSYKYLQFFCNFP